MPVGLPVALVLLAQATGAPAGPATQAVAKRAQPSSSAVPDCSPPKPDSNSREIVICAVKPDGYRLNPDVLQAKREMRSGGKPNPPENFKQNDCATIGPMGCRGSYFNVLAAAATMAMVGDRLSKGEEVGSLIVTDPHPSEYQLFLEAKKRREEKEAAAKAKAAAAARKAQADADAGNSGTNSSHP
jgi:hypothetical protein